VLLEAGAVVVPARAAGALLDVLAPVAADHSRRGVLSPVLRELVAELAAAARVVAPLASAPTSDRPSDRFRGRIVVSTAEAARRFGISDRAVRYRIDAGTLDGEQLDDGTWRVFLDDEDDQDEEAVASG
jgi:hypothetical protein